MLLVNGRPVNCLLSMDLMSATSAALGGTQNDRRVLFVTTGGETKLPVNDTASLGGKVMAVLIEP